MPTMTSAFNGDKFSFEAPETYKVADKGTPAFKERVWSLIKEVRELAK